MKFKHVGVAALLLVATAAGAQSLKPGLWEVSHKMLAGSGQQGQRMAQMDQQLASMPPAQRKKVEEMMAKQGVQMGSGASGGGMSMKICMTREMIEKNEIGGQQGDCKTTQQSRTGNTMKMAYSCTKPPSNGEGQVTFVSSEAYTMKMVATTAVNGKAEKVEMEGAGKWLGADCGKVKPLAPPPAAKR